MCGLPRHSHSQNAYGHPKWPQSNFDQYINCFKNNAQKKLINLAKKEKPQISFTMKN